MDRKGEERTEMNYFKIEAEMRAGIRELSGGEVRFWFRTDPNWTFEDIKENRGIRFIGQMEHETDEVKGEVEQLEYFVSMDTVSRVYSGNVLKAILVEMVYNRLESLYRFGGLAEKYMEDMPYAPETSGFFSRRTFDRILHGSWFEEQVSHTGSVETVLEDGTALGFRFDDTGICTVFRNGEPEGRICLTCSRPSERRKGKKPMEEQMEFAYPAFGNVVGRIKTGQGLTGASAEPWYTENRLWSADYEYKDFILGLCKTTDDQQWRIDYWKWEDTENMTDAIKGVDSLSDILESIRLYDKYHDKEGRGALMTEKIENALLSVDEEELVGMPKADWKVIVMYFDPRNLSNQWLIVSGRKRNGDWELYGLIHLLEWEWGSVSLKQLEEAARRPEDPPERRRILREVSVSGQRLEDVLKSHQGRPGWGKLL